MTDIDDELLALAGGSDEEDASSQADLSRDPSASPEPPQKRESSAKSVSASDKQEKRISRQNDDSEEEEGEASPDEPGTPNSLDSAPMDESDSDAEPAPRPSSHDDVEEKYPVEGLYTSMQEKAEIMRMREVERETILAERREESQRYKQNRLLRQLVSAAEEKEKEQKRKRSAEEADLDDGLRKTTTRQRTRAGDGIDTFRRARAEKNDRQRRREEDRGREKDKISPRKLDRDADADEDDDEAHRYRASQEASRHREPRLADFERLRISRANFAEICFKPGFEDTLMDCYCRVLGKPDRNGGQRYHMLTIKGTSPNSMPLPNTQRFTTGRAYPVTDAQGRRQFITDRHVLAGLGKRLEPYPFIAMSSGRFTEEELHRHKEALQDIGAPFPKASYLDKKLDELRALVNYSLTDVEITRMVEKKNELRKKYDPDIRKQLERDLEDAQKRGNTVLVSQLQEELEKLGKSTGLAFRSTPAPASKSATSSSSQQERLAELNRENRRRNVEAVRRAQLLERQRVREMERAIARGETVQEDHSRRLKTKAKFVHDVNESVPKKSTPSEASGPNTPTNGTPKLGAQKSALLPQLAKLQEQKYAEKKGIPTIHKPLMDDDVIAALDLDIDVEID